MIERKDGLCRLIIKDEEGSSPTIKSDWWFSEDKIDCFVRWYARRSPSDDWAETFAYYLLGRDLDNEDLTEKYNYVKMILERHKTKD